MTPLNDSFEQACLLVADYWARQLLTEAPIVTAEMKAVAQSPETISDVLEARRLEGLADHNTFVTPKARGRFRDVLARAIYKQYKAAKPDRIFLGLEGDVGNVEALLLRTSMIKAAIPPGSLPCKTYTVLNRQADGSWTAMAYKKDYQNAPDPIVLTPETASPDWVQPLEKYPAPNRSQLSFAFERWTAICSAAYTALTQQRRYQSPKR